MFKNTVEGEILTFLDGAQLQDGYCASSSPDQSVACYIEVPGRGAAPFASTLDAKSRYQGRTFTWWIGEQGESGATQHVSDYFRMTQLIPGDDGSGTAFFAEFWSNRNGSTSGGMCADQSSLFMPDGCPITEDGTKQFIATVLTYNFPDSFYFSSGTPSGPGGNVPEPVSAVLVGAGLAGIGLARRRRKAVRQQGPFTLPPLKAKAALAV